MRALLCGVEVDLELIKNAQAAQEIWNEFLFCNRERNRKGDIFCEFGLNQVNISDRRGPTDTGKHQVAALMNVDAK